MKHLLVTNDFPPKHGGIQEYLWELWRRLPAQEVTVLTTAHPEAAAWDRAQPFRVERVDSSMLLPTPANRRRIRDLADEVGAELVLLDPVAWGIGPIGPWLGRPYGVVLHGAEVAIPGRTPLAGRWMGRILRGAEVVVSAGGYPADEAERAAGRGLPIVLIPPGVDTDRYTPATADDRAAHRHHFGLHRDDEVVVSISRLVPRKGMDVLVDAAAELGRQRPHLRVVIGGDGRDRHRLERRIHRTGAPVRLVGRLDEADKIRLYQAADVFAMLCRDRWLGLEQEGFGIVFLEAAACGVPQVAGRSGGAHEAVEHGRTGLVVDRPRQPSAVATAIESLLDDPDGRAHMGQAARQRAVGAFSYDVLAERLAAGLDEVAR